MTVNRKYNIVTLNPYNKTERSLFYDFRCEDIVKKFTFQCGFGLATWLGFLINYIMNPTDISRTQVIYYLLNVAAFSTVWLFRNRFKKHLAYIIVVLAVVKQLINMQTSFALLNHDLSDEVISDLKATGVTTSMIDLMFSVAFISPSFAIAVYCYMPIFYGMQFWFGVAMVEFDDVGARLK